jgi:hypothetical protein
VSRPHKKEHHHGKAARYYSGMALVISAAPTPGASAEGLDQGWHWRVPINTAYWLKKNLLRPTTFIDLFVLLHLLLPDLWHYTPHVLPAHCTSPPYHHPLWMPVFGWLLCDILPISGRLRPSVLYFLFCFCRSNRHPNQCDNIHPTRSAPAVPPLQQLFFRCHQLYVDWCVSPSNGSQLRP